MQIHLSSVKWPLLIDFGQNIELLYTQTWWGLFFDFVGVVHGSQLSQANWNFVLGPQETKPKEETENLKKKRKETEGRLQTGAKDMSLLLASFSTKTNRRFT